MCFAPFFQIIRGDSGKKPDFSILRERRSFFFFPKNQKFVKTKNKKTSPVDGLLEGVSFFDGGYDNFVYHHVSSAAARPLWAKGLGRPAALDSVQGKTN